MGALQSFSIATGSVTLRVWVGSSTTLGVSLDDHWGIVVPLSVLVAEIVSEGVIGYTPLSVLLLIVNGWRSLL